MTNIVLRPQWDQRFSYDESIQILTGFAWSHVLEAGRFSAPLASCLRSRDWRALCDFAIDYRYTDNPLHLYHARQALGFFQKLEPLKIGVDKEAVAWRKFVEAESACKLTNEAFRAQRGGRFSFRPSVNAVLYGAQRKISRILGNVPCWSSLKFGFGPGANTSVKASASTPRYKLGAPLECSTNLIPSVSTLLSEAPLWAANMAHAESRDSYFVDVTYVNGRLQFVPKNAKTYRSIVVEPLLNSFAQRGVGLYIRKRLARAGLDLSDQTRNQKMAHSGSLTGNLCTVDLSSASDTISQEVVASLLSLDWFTLLSQFRTGKVEYRGEIIVLEKFSSMGNGFTFELESLIFFAIATAVCDQLSLPNGWTCVYGDDIIVPTEAYPLLEEVLRACGFSVNSEKSFVSGPFRESCGKDYWCGFDVRPFYQKDLVSGETLFLLHNHYMREFDRKRAAMVLKWIHPSLHLYGPDGYGDGHLIGDWSHARRSQKSEQRGWEGTRFDTFILKPNRWTGSVPGDWVAPAYAIYANEVDSLAFLDGTGPSDVFVVRGTRGYKRVSIYTLRRNIYT